MLEPPDLGVHRVAHHIQPGTVKVGVVPALLRAAGIVQHGVQRFGIPLVAMIQDHRHGLEVAPAGQCREMLASGPRACWARPAIWARPARRRGSRGGQRDAQGLKALAALCEQWCFLPVLVSVGGVVPRRRWL